MSNSTETGLDERCREAVALRQDGQYEEARRLFEDILAQDPQHPLARLEIGLIQIFTGEFDEGTATLEEVVEQQPDWHDARVHLAKSYSMLGRNEEACREFLLVLRDAPMDNPAHLEAKKQLEYFSPDLINTVRRAQS